MAECSLRPKAIADLEKIWEYTVETWGEEQAERCVRLINESFRQIADNPSRGRQCDVIRKGYRKRSVGRHVIFYRTIEGSVEVVWRWCVFSMTEWTSIDICSTLDWRNALHDLCHPQKSEVSVNSLFAKRPKKLLLRMHQKEDAIVVLLDSVEEQQELIASDPETFYITDHYVGCAAVLVRREVELAVIREIFESAWRRLARKRDIAEFDSRAAR